MEHISEMTGTTLKVRSIIIERRRRAEKPKAVTAATEDRHVHALV